MFFKENYIFIYNYRKPLKVLIIAQKLFFLGLLGCYKHFFIIFARKKQ